MMLLYGLTAFCGAFLLFLVQPMIGKYLLPWFGGGLGVWAVCLVFFQAMLLAGYAYAHLLTTRLRPRAQAALHLGLLALSLAFLPTIPSPGGKPVDGAAPTVHLLWLLTTTIGLPYFVLSATGPLVQRWLTRTRPGGLPYRFYALSNAGSLLALLSYPFVVEPLWSRVTQAWIWAGGMAVFAVLCGACAWRMARVPAGPETPGGAAATPDEIITGRRMAWWMAWPAAASLLLAAITNKLTADVAPMPFLWVLPLAVYLATFILCFDHPRWYARGIFAALLALGAATVALLLRAGAEVPLWPQIWLYPAVLFVAGMICHGEVHRLRPTGPHLTRFYLCLAAGGVGGSLFVALIAPLLFHDYYEVQIGLCAVIGLLGLNSLTQRDHILPMGLAAGVVVAFVLAPGWPATFQAAGVPWWQAYGEEVLRLVRGEPWAVPGGIVALVLCFRIRWRRPIAREWHWGIPVFAWIVAIFLGVLFFQIARGSREREVAASRNFYGVLRVSDRAPDRPLERHFELRHGRITHGAQFRAPERAQWPTTYYGKTSGAALALEEFKAGSGRHVGLVGLGAGTLAVYGQPGDLFTFYEIDPDVVRLARAPFTFLSGSAARIEILPGDARLTMEAQARRGESQQFDVLVLDAFSGDAVPVHLLTVEAMEGYLFHLKPDAMIVVHISNRYVDLRGVVVGLARHFQFDFVVVEDTPPPENYWVSASAWVLLTRNKETLRPWLPQTVEARAALEAGYHPVLWTDDHASLLGVLRR